MTLDSHPSKRPSTTVVVIAGNAVVAEGLAELIRQGRIAGVSQVVVARDSDSIASESTKLRRERPSGASNIALIVDDTHVGVAIASRSIRRTTPSIVVSAGAGDGRDWALALGRGVMWIVNPNNGFGAVREALEAVIEGRPGWTVEQLMVCATNPVAHGTQSIPVLTPRERELVGLMREGLGNKDLAVRLQVTYKTIESLQRVLYRKLGARNRMEAMSRLDEF